MTRTLVDKLIKSTEATKSIVCFGMDPVLENMPVYKRPNNIHHFFNEVFIQMLRRNVLVGAFKPNEGFYTKHDTTRSEDGSMSLGTVMDLVGAIFPKSVRILDIKRGDIGKSSKNYADHAFTIYAPDAVTVNPYMGTDSVEPFLKDVEGKQDRAAYILCRTSNPGAKDLQDLTTIQYMDDEMGPRYLPLYMRTAELIATKWHDISPGNIGAVVGATDINELQRIAFFFKHTGKQIPLLIPGVGRQGGSAKEVIDCLRNVDYNLRLVRINSSSGITEAWKKEKYTPEEFPTASVDAIQKLNEEIGTI